MKDLNFAGMELDELIQIQFQLRSALSLCETELKERSRAMLKARQEQETRQRIAEAELIRSGKFIKRANGKIAPKPIKLSPETRANEKAIDALMKFAGFTRAEAESKLKEMKNSNI